MATPINSTSTGDLWHLSIEDLLAPLPQTPRLGGAGPFVINLTASTAPISQAKELIVDERLHVYQTQRTEDHRTRYRLRLGPFPTEDEADAALGKIRETYPGAFTANAETEDLRAILSWQAKIDALRLAAERAQSELRALSSPPPAAEDAIVEVEVPLEAQPIPVLTAAVRRAGAPAAASTAAPKSVLEAAAPRPVESTAPVRRAAPRGASTVGPRMSRIATRLASASSPLMAPASTGTSPRAAGAIATVSRPSAPGTEPAEQPSARAGTAVAASPTAAEGHAERAAASMPRGVTPTLPSRAPWRPTARIAAPAQSAVGPAPSAVASPPSPVAAAPSPVAAAPSPVAAPPSVVAVPPSTVIAPPSVAAPAPSAVIAPPSAVAAAPSVVAASVAVSSALAPAGGVATPIANGAGPVQVHLLERDAAIAKPFLTKAAGASSSPGTAPARARAAAATDVQPSQGARAPVELASKLPSLESTQTVRALTPIEIEDNEVARWYVIQLCLSNETFDPDSLPNLDIFSEYRLYAVTGFDQGRVMHALRLGFVSEEMAAAAVASYLGSFYDSPKVKRVSAAERERFADHRFEARKDIGATGRHAVIEITNERVVRERRDASPPAADRSSSSATRVPPRPGR